MKMNTMSNDNGQADIPPVEQTIAELADGNQPLLNARLTDLSDLSSQQLSLLGDVWARIETKRRRQIIRRLVELAEDDVCLNFDCIFRHRLGDEDEDIRLAAIDGLWENEETSLLEAFIDLMQKDASVRVQASAASALGRFSLLAEHCKIASDYTPILSRALLSVFNDSAKSIDVRRRALEAASPLSLRVINQTIMQAYHSSDPRLKTSAIFSMGKNFDPEWLPLLMMELSADDAAIRYEAATACGELGEEEAVYHLIELTEDSDAEVQIAAVQALGKIGGSEARGQLENCLSSSSEAVCQAASQALHELEVTIEPPSSHYVDYGELND